MIALRHRSCTPSSSSNSQTVAATLPKSLLICCVALPAFAVYFDTYSRTDHRLIKGRRSTFPKFIRRRCSSKLLSKGSFRARKDSEGSTASSGSSVGTDSPDTIQTEDSEDMEEGESWAEWLERTAGIMKEHFPFPSQSF